MYIALKSFSGKVSMYEGEQRELADKAVIADLLRAGYIEEVKAEAPKKATAKASKTKQ